MKIVFISNYLNHHQKFLSDELYSLTNGDYKFISTLAIADWRKTMGWKETEASYLLQSYCEEPSEEIRQLINEADVVIIGSAPYVYVEERIKSGKLTFTYGERIYKEGVPWYKVLVHWLRYGRQYRPYPNVYRLCASAFSPVDYARIGTFVGKNFRWGYFTEVKKYDDIQKLIDEKSTTGNSTEEISILWVARLIGWKHPECAIEVARRLKTDGKNFHLTIIGDGEKRRFIEQLISEYELSDHVTLTGAMSPEEVRHYMEKSSIFLFTSDRNEGWGAVLNEAMNSACAVVASSAIGAVPYLIEDNENGCIYRDGDMDNLYRKVVGLIEDKGKRAQIGKQAYNTMSDMWCAQVAARRLLEISHCLLNGESVDIYEEGPCSKAPVIKDNWY